jgi:uncharacterized membrane protein (UPF0127 family)
MKLKKTLVFFLITLFSLGIILWFRQPKDSSVNKTRIEVEGQIIYAEIADTPAAREKGLGGKENLAENEGMLFLFPEKDYYSFWMKGMIIPIDIIWLSDSEIVDITENLSPPKNGDPLPLFKPKLPVNKVLEVNAGYVKKHNLKIGQKVVVEKVFQLR